MSAYFNNLQLLFDFPPANEKGPAGWRSLLDSISLSLFYQAAKNNMHSGGKFFGASRRAHRDAVLRSKAGHGNPGWVGLSGGQIYNQALAEGGKGVGDAIHFGRVPECGDAVDGIFRWRR